MTQRKENPRVVPEGWTPRMAYGVTVDLDKITAFIAEAEPLKPLDRISAF